MPPSDTRGGALDDDQFLSDLRGDGAGGGGDGADVDMAYEDEQAYYDQPHGDIDPRHYYTEEGRYQTDLRGFTPESEHGAGAITLYQQHEANNGPQRPFRDQGRTEGHGQYDINAYAARGGRGMQVDSSVRVPDGVEEPASPMMPGHVSSLPSSLAGEKEGQGKGVENEEGDRGRRKGWLLIFRVR